jgi:hypothetical protein
MPVQLSKPLRSVLSKLIAPPVRRQLNRFEAATREPQRVQESLLQRILAFHAETGFGRDHHFRSLRTAEDFRRRMPVASYDYFEPYMERVRRGEVRALLADAVIHMFALTSGTTAARKFIPVTPQYLADYRRGWNVWGLKALRDHPAIRLLPIVQLSGDWDELRTERDVPCGAVTGLTATMQKRIIRWLYCVPACVGRIKDPAAKCYVVLRLSLPYRASMVIAANPSTLVNLAKAGDQQKERLIRDIHDGTLDPDLDLPGDIRSQLRPYLYRHRDRAAELGAIAQRTGTLYPKDYWPQECLLGNWTGGSVGAYMQQYPRYFGAMPVRDVGLIASEGRMTIPMTDGTPSGALDVTSHYFEFMPEEEAHSPQPTVVPAHEVREGRQYYILLTTSYGLYRYHIHDLVRVTGFHNRTPLVEFLSKGANFANITGEKLSEYQVVQSMAAVLRDMNLSLTAYSLAPCWDDDLPYYGLFVERGDFDGPAQGLRLAKRVDQELERVNIEYSSKRSSQRLGPIRLNLLPPGTWSAWDRQRQVQAGGTLEQYKHPCLIADIHFRSTMPVEQEVAAP